MSVYEKMTAIADAIRDKTGETEKLGLDAMVDGVNKVYDLGEQAEYDRFWDGFQRNGTRKNYTNAFAGNYSWTDEIFKPKYPFVISSANQMFANSSLKSTVQPIDITSATSNYTYLFFNSDIVTIPKLIVAENKSLNNDFDNCDKLKNITFEGTIGKNLNMQWCPLTVESILNIVSHLQCYLNTDDEGTYSLLLSDACWKAMDEYERTNGLVYPDTNLFVREYVQCELGWLTA